MYVISVLLALVSCLTAQDETNCDFTGDGIVNFEDYSELAGTWGVSLPWGPDRPPPQLISHWRLDGNALDNQSEFHGEIEGNPQWLDGNQAAVGNGAIRMDGEDYIEIDSNFPTLNNSFTIDAWLRTSENDTQVAVSRGDSSWQLGVEEHSGCVFFSCPGLSGTQHLVGHMDISNNQWYHVAGVYNQQTQKIMIYINGNLDAEATASGQVNHRDGDIWIGGNPENPSERHWWRGDLDNIRIYNYAPTADDLFQRTIYHVDQVSGNNNNNGQSRLHAFKTIQMAIDTAFEGDMILVWPGIYQETVVFWEYKSLTVKSAADAAVIKAPGDYAVSFYTATADTVLENFVICDSSIGIFLESSSPILRFLTIVNNNIGIEAYFFSAPPIHHCIFWDNTQNDVYNNTYPPDVTFSCVNGSISGEGNFNLNPLFADPDNPDLNKRDYHLKSEYGRYFADSPYIPDPPPQNWVYDTQTSPCVDAGDENLNPMCESMPNGGRLNIGAYANTSYASHSSWPYPADLDLDGYVGWDDFLIFIESWLYVEPAPSPEDGGCFDNKAIQR